MAILRWLIRIFVGGLALVGLMVVALAVYRPVDAKYLFDFVVADFTSNNRPPPIAEGLTFETRDAEPNGTKFTAILRKRFPQGSSEQAMREELKRQGFKVSPRMPYPPPANCSRSLGGGPLCPVDYEPGQMSYSWGDAVCPHTLHIEWSVMEGHRLLGISGSYGDLCVPELLEQIAPKDTAPEAK